MATVRADIPIERRIAGMLQRGVMRTSVAQDFTIYAEGVVIVGANTNGSCGYCYVVAYFATPRPPTRRSGHDPVPDSASPHPGLRVGSQTPRRRRHQLVGFGLGPAARRQLLAAAELARRFQPAIILPEPMTQPRHVLDFETGPGRRPVDETATSPWSRTKWRTSFDSALATTESTWRS